MTRDRVRDTLDAQAAGTPRVLAERYRLERLLGSGGMGEVWEARHLLLDRVVAIKLLTLRGPEVAERLLREARVLARVRHPAIVEVYDCGLLEDGTPFVVMERLIGETLGQAIDRGPLAPAEAVPLFVTLLDGLGAAHTAGVIHRDLKPENMFLVDGGAGVRLPRLLDFGIARLANEVSARQTMAGTVMGTPGYMAPEQFRGEPTDERTDIWGIAVSLYEAVTGTLPFGDGSLPMVMQKVLEAPVPFPRQVRDLDGRLWAVLARGLRKVPAQRYPSATAMRDDLLAWLGAPSQTAPSHPTSQAPSQAPFRSTLDDVIRRKLRGD